MPAAVNCPTCGTKVPWISKSRFRPFCCDRCRLIDLGAWANEAYRVAQPAASDSGSEPGKE